MEAASTDSRKRNTKADEKKLSKEHIGFPSEFSHVSHVGWDPKGGFQINNIDPQWKKLFGAIGVTEKQLEDEETLNLVSKFVESRSGIKNTDRQLSKNAQNSHGSKFYSPLPTPDDPQPLPVSRSATLPPKPARSDVTYNEADETLSYSNLKKGKSKSVGKRLSKEDIGVASDFRHIGHVGFDSSYIQSGFESNDAENPIKEHDEPEVNLECSDPLRMKNQYLTSPQSWTVEDVCAWLRSIALEDYVDVFTMNAIDGTELMQLNDDSLLKGLNISPLGHRNKIMREIDQLNQLSYDNGDGLVDYNNDNEVVPSDFLCPITMEIMEDPVIAADGFTYERLSIVSWLSSGKVTSPMTNIPLSHTELVPNRSLKSIIERFFGP